MPTPSLNIRHRARRWRSDRRGARRHAWRYAWRGFRRSGQLAKFRQNTGGAALVHDAAAGRLIQHGFDLIAGGQGEIDKVGGGRKLAVAQPVESAFEIVREAGDVVEAEHRARSFDGM